MPQRSPSFNAHSLLPCVVFRSWKGPCTDLLVSLRQFAPFRSTIVWPRGSFPEHAGLGCASAGPSLPRACGSVSSGLSTLPVACVWHHAVSGPQSSCRLAFSPQSRVGPGTPRLTPLASGLCLNVLSGRFLQGLSLLAVPTAWAFLGTPAPSSSWVWPPGQTTARC